MLQFALGQKVFSFWDNIFYNVQKYHGGIANIFI